MSALKYELLPADPATGLHRIRALRDIPRRAVLAGDVGGWVAGPANLYQGGDAWVGGDAQVDGDARVFGDAWVLSVRDLLVITPVASASVTLTATPTRDGEHRVRVGCWTGTVDDLAAVIAGDEWPSGCDEETRDAHRPEMEAVIALVRARVATWATLAAGATS